MTTPPSLAAALRDAVVVLDGGLATQLEAQGHDLSSDLWSARLLADEPQQVVAAHRAFLDAGAQVATTASYQASATAFARSGIDRDTANTLLRRSVALAREAIDSVPEDRPRWVAASVGPYGAMLADGSEYTGRYGLGVDELRAFHHERLHVLAECAPDVLAIETVPCLAEVEAIVVELETVGLPAWISITASGTSTRAGEPAVEAFALAAGSPAVVALGVNCTHPSDLTALLELAASVTDKPLVAYPNSGEDWDGARRVWTGSSRFEAGDVQGWLTAGVRLIGGCCRVAPDDIRAIAAVADA